MFQYVSMLHILSSLGAMDFDFHQIIQCFDVHSQRVNCHSVAKTVNRYGAQLPIRDKGVPCSLGSGSLYLGMAMVAPKNFIE